MLAAAVEAVDLGTVQSWAVALGAIGSVVVLAGMWWSVARKSGSRDRELEQTRELAKETSKAAKDNANAIADLGKYVAVHTSEIKEIRRRVDGHDSQIAEIFGRIHRVKD